MVVAHLDLGKERNDRDGTLSEHEEEMQNGLRLKFGPRIFCFRGYRAF